MKKFPAIVTCLPAGLLLGLLAIGQATAKLPPPSDEAKAKAAETKAKSAWSDKVAAYQLCLVQDKTAAGYLKATGKSASAAEGISPCADPGPYVSASAVSTVTSTAAPAMPAPQSIAKKP
ncbi:hypothetical protein ACFQAT_18135 [Undibacterium arcticum]|uniref:Uncharacterized protein n=1 Tax=Undibacterium arcticum TaxID=1762892 RepID=A0ABV7F400_9BURK